MWKRVAVDPEKRYVLQLCQNAERSRYFLARETGESPHPDMVLETIPVAAKLVAEYRFDELQNLRLSNGESFSFGPHGEWFTESETIARMEMIRGLRGWASIPWHNGIEPRLPPK